MKKRRLGHSSLEVAPLAFGGNVFGWTVDEATSFALLDKFTGGGFNLIDTADVYSRWVRGHTGGESETVIGKWLKKSGKRKDVVIATKVGMDMGEGKKGLRTDYILRAVEDSLRRLQTDYIDLYQSHTDDAEASQEESLEAYAQLVKQGKVRVIGASNFSAERLQHALKLSHDNGYPVYQSLQPEYNLYRRREFEHNLEQVCLAHGLGVIPYFSLASGFLTGKYRSEKDFGKSVRGGSMGKYLNERGLKILDTLDAVAKEHNATPAQVALAWLMARPSVTAPIASATSVAQLDELMNAAELKLTGVDIARLDTASA
ncbi:MAG TPA: aldo/keto reductase [Burkholderiaceae bacterium]